ncbi:UNVERIFIED_CONTAM: hypothetical protein Slati_0385300 [Sesamum latifolium]|uniref:Uncharacterized protein n=1 Tax=Sesamum latifolium TaxID=2727402 RepID=A0AAW2XUX2_9LAMI
MAESVKEMTAKFSKLDKFEGVDFRRCQKKMHFLLTTLKVVYALSTPFPNYMVDETVANSQEKQNVESAKALWDGLEAKYMAEDASSKKFLMMMWLGGLTRGLLSMLAKIVAGSRNFNQDDGSVLHMGNESSAPVVGVGSVF